MKLEFQQLQNENIERIVEWLCSQEWPFHGYPPRDADTIRNQALKGYYWNEDARAFWIHHGENKRIGYVRLFEIQDLTARFDMRFKTECRGHGFGRQALKWLTDYTFFTFSGIQRLEGQTREDNVAMQKVFEACGFVKEGHFRQAWPAEGNTLLDTFSYAIIREDWENKTTTPINSGLSHENNQSGKFSGSDRKNGGYVSKNIHAIRHSAFSIKISESL